MPRVVPSQVVAFIDTIPLPPTEGFTINHPGVDTSEVAGLADLLDQIPEELLTMDAAAYASFICCKARIRETLAAWATQPARVPETGRILYSAQADAIRGIRYLLAKCPDESPAPATSELKFITDPDFRTNLRNDIGGVNRALSNGEWKPATVLAGSAIEALLLWSLSQRKAADIAKAIGALRKSGELTRQPDPKLERWDPHEFTEVAANLGIIKPDTAIETRLARGFRNLIHPGRAQRLGQKCDRGTALSSVAASTTSSETYLSKRTAHTTGHKTSRPERGHHATRTDINARRPNFFPHATRLVPVAGELLFLQPQDM